MAGIFSTELWHTLLPTSPVTPAQLFVVPAGQVCVVRSIDHWCGSGIPTRADYGELVADLFWTAVFMSGLNHPSGQWRGRQVFTGGQIITGQADADLLFSRGSGYLFTS